MNARAQCVVVIKRLDRMLRDAELCGVCSYRTDTAGRLLPTHHGQNAFLSEINELVRKTADAVKREEALVPGDIVHSAR